jgi:hypothetical protein
MWGNKKGRFRVKPAKKGDGWTLGVGGGLAETLNAVAFLPLAALAEKLDALEALEDVAFNDDSLGTLEAAVLRHGVER